MHGQRNIKFYLKGTRDEAFYVVTDSTKHSPPKFNSSSDSRKYSKFTHTDADKWSTRDCFFRTLVCYVFIIRVYKGVYIKVLSFGISNTPKARHGCQTDFSNIHILSKYVFHRIGGNHPQHSLSFAVYKILNTYLCCYNMILLFVRRPFTICHEFQRSISFSQNF